MSTAAFVFMLIGVVSATSYLFKLIELVER